MVRACLSLVTEQIQEAAAAPQNGGWFKAIGHFYTAIFNSSRGQRHREYVG
jgi:hypothetical protein